MVVQLTRLLSLTGHLNYCTDGIRSSEERFLLHEIWREETRPWLFQLAFILYFYFPSLFSCFATDHTLISSALPFDTMPDRQRRTSICWQLDQLICTDYLLYECLVYTYRTEWRNGITKESVIWKYTSFSIIHSCVSLTRNLHHCIM